MSLRAKRRGVNVFMAFESHLGLYIIRDMRCGHGGQ